MLKAAVFLFCASVAYSVTPKSIDVSAVQQTVIWATVKSNGVEFAYAKATEGTGYINPKFSEQSIGAAKAGLIRGAYHAALPDRSSGAAQAAHFVQNGGRWTNDGITLPGALGVAFNDPNGGALCFGKTQPAMVAWIRDFSNAYRSRTGRFPVIYATTLWWTTCTGNDVSFGASNPLWISNYATVAVGPLPTGWKSYTFWKNAESGPSPGNQDVFFGDRAGLLRLARNQ